MSKPLKPCPFCGSTEIYLCSNDEIDSDDQPIGEQSWYVSHLCDRDSGVNSCTHVQKSVVSKGDAVAAWNRRSPSPSDAAGAGEVEEALRELVAAVGAHARREDHVSRAMRKAYAALTPLRR